VRLGGRSLNIGEKNDHLIDEKKREIVRGSTQTNASHEAGGGKSRNGVEERLHGEDHIRESKKTRCRQGVQQIPQKDLHRKRGGKKKRTSIS